MKMLTKILEKVKSADFILVTISTVVCSGMTFIFNTYSKDIVKSDLLGVNQECLAVLAFMNYAQLGVFNAYNRDYPQVLGRKDFNAANKLKNTTMTFMLMVYLLILVLFEIFVFVYSNVADPKYSKYYAFGLALCPILMLTKSFDDMTNNTLRMDGRYNLSALLGFVRHVLAFIIGIVALKFTNYYGLYAMTLASAIIGILFFAPFSMKGIKFDFDFKYMKGLILAGLPLMINSLIWTGVQNVDKFVIKGFMSKDEQGNYSLATMGFTTMVLVPQTISQVFYNKIGHLYGANKDEKQVLDKASFYTALLSIISGAACIFVFYVTPSFAERFSRNVTKGIVSTQILIIGVAIYATTMIFGNVFSILRLNKSLVANSLALCIFDIVFSTGLVVFVERSINMVALGTGLSYALYSLLLMIKLSRKFDYPFTKLFIKSWVPVLAIIVPGVLFYLLMDSVLVAAGLALFTAAVVCVIIVKLFFAHKS
ncbi:MAG: lipopolysaccharide biosynthesis protein [Pseudobutyrivibrio sp.]|nr:lipopolysaccharide biosynthesis protein [Pseudobutyrivibrio sp.]